MDYLFASTEKSEGVRISELTREKPVLLVLLRHVGCPICRNFLSQLREHAKSIEANGVSIVAVVPANVEQLKEFLDVYGPYPFAILGDPEQYAYKNLQLKKVSVMKSGKIIFEYLKEGRMREIFPKEREQAKVVRNAMLSQDVYQLGATLLIDTTGEILWQHIDNEPADHAAIPAIIENLKRYVPK